MEPKKQTPAARPAPMTRRRFVQSSAGAVAAAATFGRVPTSFAAEGKPAALGGEPLRRGHWPSWPITGPSEEDALRKVLHDGSWYRYAGNAPAVSRIHENTRCLLPVHLGGASCDIDRLMEIARRRGLDVVEDSCQTHQGEWNGQRLGKS